MKTQLLTICKLDAQGDRGLFCNWRWCQWPDIQRLDIKGGVLMLNRHTSGIALLMAVVLGLNFSSGAQADIISYIGNEFDVTDAGAGNVEMTLEFSSDLVASSTLTLSDLRSWSITAAGRTITNNDSPTFAVASFLIGDNLLPVQWDFAIEKNIEGDNRPEQWSSLTDFFFNTGFVFDAFSLDDDRPFDVRARGNPFSVKRDMPGTWTTVPEPSTLVLSGLGLLTLGLIAARRSRFRESNHFCAAGQTVDVVEPE